MNTYDRFCPRCRKEYNDIDNYGTFHCKIHTGELRTNADGRIYYTCCPQNTRPLDYHPKNNKVVQRNFGFNYRCSRIRLPPPCTPCDHGDIRNKDGTDKTITLEQYYNMLPAAQADARIQLLIANGALPHNPSNDTEIFRIQVHQDSDEDLFDEDLMDDEDDDLMDDDEDDDMMDDDEEDDEEDNEDDEDDDEDDDLLEENNPQDEEEDFHMAVLSYIGLTNAPYVMGDYEVNLTNNGVGLFTKQRIDKGKIADLSEFGTQYTVETRTQPEHDDARQQMADRMKHQEYLLSTLEQQHGNKWISYIYDPYDTKWGFMNDPFNYTPVDIEWYGDDLLFKYPSGRTKVVSVPGYFVTAMENELGNDGEDFYAYKMEDDIFIKHDLEDITAPLRIIQIDKTDITRQPNIEVRDEGIFALREIDQDEELFFEYGDQYPWADLL